MPAPNKKYYKRPIKLKDKDYTTSVTLIKDDERKHVFFCPDCRNAVIEYCGEVVSIIPGGSPQELPITVFCKNHRCKRKYIFSYFVELE